MTSLSDKFLQLLLIYPFLIIFGGCSMAADIDLKWEWPDEREAKDKLLVKIKNIKKESSGLFGTKKSPSLVDALPDATKVTGLVLSDDKAISGKSVELVLPALELEGISSGNLVMLGLVNTNTCICIKAVESEDSDLSKISCN